MPVSIRDDYAPGTRNGNTCSCCSAGRRDVYDATGPRKELIVDLGVSIDMEGWLMICESCVREAAGLLGMVDPAEAVALRSRLDQVNAEAAELRVELAEARQLVTLVREYDARRDTPAATETVGMPEPAMATEPVLKVSDAIAHVRTAVDAASSGERIISTVTGAGVPTFISGMPELHKDEQPEDEAAPIEPAAHEQHPPQSESTQFQFRRGPGRPRNQR